MRSLVSVKKDHRRRRRRLIESVREAVDRRRIYNTVVVKVVIVGVSALSFGRWIVGIMA